MGKYERIKTLCKEQGTSVAEMERTLKFARGSIAKIDEHKPSIDKVAKICDYLNVSPMYLFMGDDADLDDFDEAKKYTDAINAMPPTQIEVAAGSGRINDEYENTSEYSTVRICGDSMYPSLHDGDLVRVHHVTDDISPHDFAIVKINGDESTCKHIEITNDGIWLRAENNDVFEDTFYSVQEVLTVPVTIIGKAVAIVERKL